MPHESSADLASHYLDEALTHAERLHRERQVAEDTTVMFAKMAADVARRSNRMWLAAVIGWSLLLGSWGSVWIAWLIKGAK